MNCSPSAAIAIVAGLCFGACDINKSTPPNATPASVTAEQLANRHRAVLYKSLASRQVQQDFDSARNTLLSSWQALADKEHTISSEELLDKLESAPKEEAILQVSKGVESATAEMEKFKTRINQNQLGAILKEDAVELTKAYGDTITQLSSIKEAVTRFSEGCQRAKAEISQLRGKCDKFQQLRGPKAAQELWKTENTKIMQYVAPAPEK